MAEEIQVPNKEHDQGTNLLRKTHKIGSNFEEIRIENNFRKANRCANMLAKQGSNVINEYIYECSSWWNHMLLENLHDTFVRHKF